MASSLVARLVTSAASPGVELSSDERFAGRVRRLTVTSVVALGIVRVAAADLEHPPQIILRSLEAGWLLMPLLLWLSLRLPRLRYALVLPASLVTVPALAAVASGWASSPLAAAGWWLLAIGLLQGGLLGAWFWFRLVPVPDALLDPFGWVRMALIATHVSFVVVGLAAAVLASAQ